MVDSPQAVILAAGKGTRMKSNLPKVLHQVGGKALLQHVIDSAVEATAVRPLVIANPEHVAVRALARDQADVVEQATALGTGDAVRQVPEAQRSRGPVLVLCGDVPLLRPDTLRRLLDHHQKSQATCTVLVVEPDHPRGLGRIVRDNGGKFTAIVEERDLTPEQCGLRECNSGVYIFNGAQLWPALDRITTNNAQGEYYLTDVVALMEGTVATVTLADSEEALGISDRCDLAEAEAILRARTLQALMESGVTIEDPLTTYVDSTVVVGQDTVLRPMTSLRGHTVLGPNCTVGPMAQLRDVRAGEGAVIGSSHLEECTLGDRVTIGHYNRIRPGTTLGAEVSLGTHAELKNSTVGHGTQIAHFSCVLDSDIGTDVNIGAGTVTCNFDGEGKHRTVIGDGVFVGSDATFIAPVQVAAGAYIAAGSLIDADVPEGALGIARSRQRNIGGWVEKRRQQATTR